MLHIHESSLPFGNIVAICLFFYKYFNWEKKNHMHACGCYRDELNLVMRALEMWVLVQQEAAEDVQHTQRTA